MSSRVGLGRGDLARCRHRRMTSCTKTMRVLMACIALWCAASAGVAVAQDVDTPEAEPPSALARSSDGPALEIAHFELRYRFEHPNHPDLDALRDLPIALGLVRDGYVAPREGLRVEWTTLGQLMTPSATERYYASALQRILESVLAWYTSREFIGVFVGPDPNDITSASVDVRPEGRTAVAIVIATARVTELRTLASGDRVSDHGPILPEDRINNPKHARHIESSPIRPWGGESWIPRTDLLRGDAINDHMFFLSRHPGRRVDASISAADEPGTAALDYLITENNPLTIFAQVSNTGTPSTSNWRERIGLYHTQLTENDDILSLDYVTGDFDRAHSFRGSYEAPFGTPRLRWRITGNWSQYNSEEVGFFDANFSGNTWGFSAEFIANLYQDRQLFVDIITGVRVAEHEVDNSLVGQGKETFSLPFFGVQVEKQTDWYDTRGSAILEFQAGAPDDMQLERLGRTDPDDKWIVLRWFTSHSVYLEPLLDRAAWEDPTTPGSSTPTSRVFLAESMVCWRISFSGVGCGRPGLLQGRDSLRGVSHETCRCHRSGSRHAAR